MADLERKFPTTVFQARANFYEAQRKGLDQLVEEYLLEQQAKKEGLTVAQLFERHVDKALPPDPSDDVLKLYFEGVDTNEPFAAVRDKIVEAIRQRRLTKAKTAYIQSLREQASIRVTLDSPRAPITKGTPPRGPENAKIVLLEYADYECSYCQQIQPTVNRLETEFKGKLAYSYKDYPLPMHANAQKAAEASHCAEAQGKYWQYHDRLVAEKQFDLGALKGYARDVKLDQKRFDKCLDSGETAESVKAQATEAQSLGLQGTPTFFVNGRYVSGTLSYERLRAVIEEELKFAEHGAGASGQSRAMSGSGNRGANQ